MWKPRHRKVKKAQPKPNAGSPAEVKIKTRQCWFEAIASSSYIKVCISGISNLELFSTYLQIPGVSNSNIQKFHYVRV